MISTESDEILQLVLKNGKRYQDIDSKRPNNKQFVPHTYVSFEKYIMNIDLRDFNQVDFDDEKYRNTYRMQNVSQLGLSIDSLSKKGLSFGLVNVRKLKPLPDDQLIQIIGDLGKVVTVEESVLEGGFGSAVSSMLHQHSMNNELLQIGLPCSFIEGGSNEELSSIYGVDSKGIARQIFERWKKDNE